MSSTLAWYRFYILLVAVTSTFLSIQPCSAQQPEENYFKMADTSAYSMPSAASTLADVSGPVQCAVSCARTPSCFAFQYNVTARSCFVGGDVTFTGAALGADIMFFMRGFDATLTCSSRSYAYAECGSPSPAVSVGLSRQLSRSACTLGTSFGLTATGDVWVDAGCRGEFSVRF